MASNTEDEHTARAREIANAANNQWRNDNLEAKRAYERAYYANNKEKMREQARNSYAAMAPEIKAERVAYQKQWQKDHPEARKEVQRRYRERNKQQIARAEREYSVKPVVRERRRVRKAATLETLAGRPRPELCDACGGPPDKGKSLHYDHCHRHGHFRGWICRDCNLILGYAKDEPARLLKLIAYIKRGKPGAIPQFNLTGI
jgi:hypothetical protein